MFMSESKTNMFTETFPQSGIEKQRVSRLTPELQGYVRTPEFKVWFGDWEGDPDNASKIVDENGEPRLVYTGAPAGITQFAGDKRNRTGQEELGFYSTKRRSNARAMAEQIHRADTDESAPSSLYGVFLNIKHPRVVEPHERIDTTSLTEIPEGYDGYVNDKLQEMVVFDPNQIAIVSETPVNQ
jgi:hypothetical protein